MSTRPGHPTDDELRLVALSAESAPAAAREHVAGCADCAREVAIIADLSAVAGGDPGACPDSETLVGLVDETLPDEARRAAGAHVEACRRCAAVVSGLLEADEQVDLDPGPSAAAAPTLLERLRALVTFELPEALSFVPRTAGVADPAVYDSALRHLGRGEADAAVVELERLIASGADSPEVQHVLGCARVIQGEVDSAIEHLKSAADDRPQLGDYRFRLAQALLLGGRAEEAQVELARLERKGGPLRAAARELGRSVREAVEGSAGSRTTGEG